MATDRTSLLHCEERLRRIQKYCEGGRAPFMESRLQQDAVLLNLQMICLSARAVSGEERQKHPHVDWHGLCNLCDGLISAEMSADPDRIWRIVEQRVSALQHQLRLVLTSKT
jgi:uncharacterized protein with HEPN domain